jgi:hypothetical protein
LDDSRAGSSQGRPADAAMDGGRRAGQSGLSGRPARAAFHRGWSHTDAVDRTAAAHVPRGTCAAASRQRPGATRAVGMSFDLSLTGAFARSASQQQPAHWQRRSQQCRTRAGSRGPGRRDAKRDLRPCGARLQDGPRAHRSSAGSAPKVGSGTATRAGFGSSRGAVAAPRV